MRYALLCISLAVTGCSASALNRRATHEEDLATMRSQLGDAAGAERALQRAEALRQEARLKSEDRHGWLWHDLAMD
jgi:hypothetical protein